MKLSKWFLKTFLGHCTTAGSFIYSVLVFLKLTFLWTYIFVDFVIHHCTKYLYLILADILKVDSYFEVKYIIIYKYVMILYLVEQHAPTAVYLSLDFRNTKMPPKNNLQ